MKQILLRAYSQLRLMYKIGISSYLKYLFSIPGALLQIRVNNTPVYVRRGTPDLEVAVSCLFGEFEILRYLLPENYSGNIVDAGGYIGTATLALRKLFPHAHIIVVEPSNDNLSVIKKNLESISNFEIVHGALVGGDIKSAELKNRGTGGVGFTVISKPKDVTDAKTIQETKTYRLKDLVEDTNSIGLMKLDVEGSEVDIIKNDSEHLDNIPVIFAELHDRIIEGCSELFFKFSRNRILLKSGGEKYLSIRR